MYHVSKRPGFIPHKRHTPYKYSFKYLTLFVPGNSHLYLSVNLIFHCLFQIIYIPKFLNVILPISVLRFLAISCSFHVMFTCAESSLLPRINVTSSVCVLYDETIFGQ
jgi:hypothetical protein